MAVAAVILGVVLAGSLFYCVLIVFAARSYLAVHPPPAPHDLPISVLKPLHGLDEGLDENLRSFFGQQYSNFELVFAVHAADDPAVAVLNRVRADFPQGPPVRLIVTGEPPGPNAKAFSLARMVAEAHHDLLVMSDSDVRAAPDFLARMAAEFADQQVGVVTCPYRAVAGESLWSELEVIGMNTEFLGGVLVARMIEGMKFALGPTLAARRGVLERMGGFDYLGSFLAEDFELGRRAVELGSRVLLSSSIIEHRIGAQPFLANLRHRLRWARSTRRSRPRGYWGQAFTYPLPTALLLCAAVPRVWPLLLVTLMVRVAAAWAVAGVVLHDPLTHRCWWLLPLQDIYSFVVWIGGFFGNTVQWRGRKLELLPDGRFRSVS